MANRITNLFGGDDAVPLASPATIREVEQGRVIGSVAENGADVWRGLPYAASTGGENRWRAPRPAPGWTGVRQAIEHGPRCAQLTNRGDRDEGLEPGQVIGSEDCLTLDIYAPPRAEGRSLPVMVWIHGGGNVWGRSSLYDGSRLAVNEDVLVVAIQFRVGPLGWFSHPALRGSASIPTDRAACFTTLDIIAALEWIGRNISSFGGDPGCVTVFGESSGGHNVATLLASPLAAGLFHRAIIQSGSFDSISVAEAEGVDGTAANPSNDIARRLGATTADELRAASVEELYAACEVDDGWFLDVPRVIEDGVALPATPLRDAFTSTETFNVVPIITGTNRDEMKLFFMGDERMIEKRFGALIVPRDADFYDAVAHYISRVWRLRSVVEPAAAMAAAGHDQVFAYQFDWDDGGRLLAMDFGQLLGAAHGLEIPFVFNRFHHLGDADRFLFGRGTRRDREVLSRAIGRYWASFARTGVPSCPGRPAWPPASADGGGVHLCLDTDNDGGVRRRPDNDSIESLAEDLGRDRRLDRAERQAIVDEMGRWMFTRPLRAELESLLERDQPTGTDRPPQGAIFYTTRYGSTAAYAGWIAEATGLPAYAITDGADPGDYDFLVLGSPVMHYRLSIRDWVRDNAEQIRGKPAVLFTVSGAPASPKLDGWVVDSLPNSLLSGMDHVALRGRWRPEQLTFFDRMTVTMAGLVNRDRQARKDELQGFDYVDRTTIAPIVEAVAAMSSTAVEPDDPEPGPGRVDGERAAPVDASP